MRRWPSRSTNCATPSALSAPASGTAVRFAWPMTSRAASCCGGRQAVALGRLVLRWRGRRRSRSRAPRRAPSTPSRIAPPRREARRPGGAATCARRSLPSVSASSVSSSSGLAAPPSAAGSGTSGRSRVGDAPQLGGDDARPAALGGRCLERRVRGLRVAVRLLSEQVVGDRVAALGLQRAAGRPERADAPRGRGRARRRAPCAACARSRRTSGPGSAGAAERPAGRRGDHRFGP